VESAESALAGAQNEIMQKQSVMKQAIVFWIRNTRLKMGMLTTKLKKTRKDEKAF